MQIDQAESGFVVAVLEQAGFHASELTAHLDVVEAGLLGGDRGYPVDHRPEDETIFHLLVSGDHVHEYRFISDVGGRELQIVVHGVFEGEQVDLAGGIHGNAAGHR